MPWGTFGKQERVLQDTAVADFMGMRLDWQRVGHLGEEARSFQYWNFVFSFFSLPFYFWPLLISGGIYQTLSTYSTSSLVFLWCVGASRLLSSHVILRLRCLAEWMISWSQDVSCQWREKLWNRYVLFINHIVSGLLYTQQVRHRQSGGGKGIWQQRYLAGGR